MSIIKEFKVWRNDRRKRLEMLKGNEAYLWNNWLDYDGLQKLFSNLPEDRSATLFALDGTRIEISKSSYINNSSNGRRINWDS